MKISFVFLSALLALPAVAAPQNLKLCRGGFMISSAPASQETVEGFLAGSVRANIVVAKVLGSGAGKLYQVQAANPATVESATAVMQVLAQLEGVIVECDSELGQ